MPKAKVNYYAYAVYTAGAVDIGVDTNPAKLWARLAEDLKAADGDGGMERLVTGQVWGDDKEDAMNAVRKNEWLPDDFADCKAASEVIKVGSQEVLTVPLKDAYDQEATPQRVQVKFNDLGIGLHFPGYGDHGTADPHGEPVFIEYRNGVPHVVVWQDIQQEDPTHVIGLEDAKIERQLPE